MATAAEALFSAALGLGGGLIGAALLERLKAGVASLDSELSRLEALEDELFDVFESPADDPDRGAALRRIAGRRRRLGQNIRRKVPETAAYAACKAELVLLDGLIIKAEDAEPLSDELETEIQGAFLRLRSRLKRSSRTARAFAVLRGDA